MSSRNEEIRITKNRGITLVALVVTVVILIILATVSISVTFGENGLIAKTRQAKRDSESAIAGEQEELEQVEQKIANIINGEGSTLTPPAQPYVDSTLPGAPKVTTGLTPVKYNEETSKWERTTVNDNEWYDYANKKWANAVLGGATFDSNGNLDENETYSMVVWVPRYAYKITSNWHTNSSTAGDIDVVFIDTNNKDKNGVEHNGIYNGEIGTYSDYVVHPAFDYGSKKLKGFWIGKFESSHTDCATTSSTGEYNGTDKTMQIRAGVTSWRSIQVSIIYRACIELNKSENVYGLGTDIDPHMCKNTEWGACAYLSKSRYGKETEEVWINNSSTYITGNAGSSVSASSTSGITNAYNTENGVKASTTGNVYGVYDMSGGANEYVAGYVNNSYADDYATNLANSTKTEHKDVYNVGTSDSKEDNYAAASGKYGDAVYETSSSGNISNSSWYSDYANFPWSSSPFFERGGPHVSTTYTGVFYFYSSYGSGGKSTGFRAVLSPLS